MSEITGLAVKYLTAPTNGIIAIVAIILSIFAIVWCIRITRSRHTEAKRKNCKHPTVVLTIHDSFLSAHRGTGKPYCAECGQKFSDYYDKTTLSEYSNKTEGLRKAIIKRWKDE